MKYTCSLATRCSLVCLHHRLSSSVHVCPWFLNQYQGGVPFTQYSEYQKRSIFKQAQPATIKGILGDLVVSKCIWNKAKKQLFPRAEYY